MQTLKVVRSGRICESLTRYTSPNSVFDRLCEEMRCFDREHFIVIHLDGKNQIVGKETISIGSLNQSIVEPREVFKGAIINGSASVILAHNHPSGDPSPSPQDVAVTERLQRVGEIIGIQVLDHIIFGDGCYYSFIKAEDSRKLMAEKDMLKLWNEFTEQNPEYARAGTPERRLGDQVFIKEYGDLVEAGSMSYQEALELTRDTVNRRLGRKRKVRRETPLRTAGTMAA